MGVVGLNRILVHLVTQFLLALNDVGHVADDYQPQLVPGVVQLFQLHFKVLHIIFLFLGLPGILGIQELGVALNKFQQLLCVHTFHLL
jgi:hypothetical protein